MYPNYHDKSQYVDNDVDEYHGQDLLYRAMIMNLLPTTWTVR